jgi:hypothetical protein
MSYQPFADAPRRRAINVDFRDRSKARQLVAPTRDKLADWQQRIPLYLALAEKRPRSGVVKIETALMDVERERARLDRAVSEEPPSVATNGFVLDARRALEHLESVLVEGKKRCS